MILVSIEQFVSPEACRQCRGCCRFLERQSAWSPRLLREEIPVLLKGGVPPLLITGDYRLRLEKAPGQEEYFCPVFNREESRCRIYSCRPFECRLYPFLLNRDQGKFFLAVDGQCPGVRESLRTVRFQEYVDYLFGFLDGAAAGLRKNNPEIFQEYPGVVNLQELRP